MATPTNTAPGFEPINLDTVQPGATIPSSNILETLVRSAASMRVADATGLLRGLCVQCAACRQAHNDESLIRPGPHLCCLAVHAAEPFAVYPELIREWNKSGGRCQAEDCGRAMLFTASGQLITKQMVDEGDAEEADYSALACVFSLQRLRNHRLHQRHNIGGAICCECNWATNSNDLKQYTAQCDPICTQPHPESPAFTPGGPASDIPQPPSDYVGPGFASKAKAAEEGVHRSQSHHQAVAATIGTPVRARKGPSCVPSRAEEAASLGISVGQERRRRQAESQGRTLRRSPPSHSRTPTAAVCAAQQANAAQRRRPVEARLFQSNDDWEPYESVTAAAQHLGCEPAAVRSCITNRSRYATVASKDRYEFREAQAGLVDDPSERSSSEPSPIRPRRPTQNGSKRRRQSLESDDSAPESIEDSQEGTPPLMPDRSGRLAVRQAARAERERCDPIDAGCHLCQGSG
jgi:hypothetical protein